MVRAKCENRHSDLRLNKNYGIQKTELINNMSNILLKSFKEYALEKFNNNMTNNNDILRYSKNKVESEKVCLLKNRSVSLPQIKNNISNFLKRNSERKIENDLSLHDLPEPEIHSLPSTTMLLPYFSVEDQNNYTKSKKKLKNYAISGNPKLVEYINKKKTVY